MKYNVGDRVRIKSIDWYNENKGPFGELCPDFIVFLPSRSKYCGQIMTIKEVLRNSYNSDLIYYKMIEDAQLNDWTNGMIEGLVKEECPQDFIEKYCKSCGTQRCDRTKEYLNGCPYYNAYVCEKQNNNMEEKTKPESKFYIGDIVYSQTWQRNVVIQEILPYGFYTVGELYGTGRFKIHENHLCKDIVKPTDEYTLPDGYIFKDENGNVINATKIVLEKKPDDKLKLESTKKVREYWSEYARIYIEIYDNEPNECVLTHLYTLEGHRQKGYGRQALIEAESIAKELGCYTAYLKVETNSWMHEWYLRMGYKWYKTADKEYTWLVKNLTSIEKKKKKYPKTYEECCVALEYIPHTDDIIGYKWDILQSLQKLLICRDAYWKIAGEEMGLGKPWENSRYEIVYGICRDEGNIVKLDDYWGDTHLFEFPIREMRDAFKENFGPDIEFCKELL